MAKDEKEKEDPEPDEEFQDFHSPDAYSFELDETREDESLGEADLNYYPEEFNAELDKAAKEVDEKEKKKKQQEELIAKKEAAVMASASKVKIKSTKPVKKKKKAVKKKIVKKVEEAKVEPEKEIKEEAPKIEEKEEEKKKRIKIFSGKNIAIAASIIFILLVMTFVVFNAVSDAIDQQNADNVEETETPKETPVSPVDSQIADTLFEKLKNKES